LSDYNAGLRVLAGILPSDKRRVLYVLGRLTPEHFRDKIERSLFTLITGYYEKHQGVLPAAVLRHMLDVSGMDKGEMTLYAQTFVTAARMRVDEDDFRYSVQALKDDVEHEKTGQVIATAFEILERGIETKDGALQQGYAAAQEYVMQSVVDLKRLAGSTEMPEGDVRMDRDEALVEYLMAKNAPAVVGMPTGIASVDKVTGGLVPGDLALVAAYTGQGKSMLSAQMSWGAMTSGHNTVYVTSETTRSVIRRRIIARHSRLPQFDCPNGLDSNRLKQGLLTDVEEAVHRNVLDDLHDNPAYGVLNVIQIPRGTTLTQVETRLMRANHEAETQFIVIDYLNLLRSERRYDSERSEASEILKDAKQFATAFDSGRAVPLLSPWQITQDAFKIAADLGHYSLRSLAETAEAVRSPDVIMTLLRTPEHPKRAKMQLLKTRDGADIFDPFDLEVDYRNAYLTEPPMATLPDSTDFAELLGKDYEGAV
jgi:replicative DNA helicase